MERKQLDFNAPLLSVRRFTSTIASLDGDNGKIIENSLPNRWNSLPSYNSDMELGEVTKPAAVPFMWEQIPGRPKGGSDAQPEPPKEPSNTPRLPPGKVLSVVKRLSGEVSEDHNMSSPQIKESSSNNNATLLESFNKETNEKGDSDIESGDDAYSDALETLSPTESFSLNCSLSGLSGYDGLDVKPSGTFFSTDPQTRDFLMSRFLPAAKAMVLETPQYVSRKQPVAPEQPKLVKKVVSGERQPLLKQYRSNIMPRFDQNVEDVESEDEDEDDEYDDTGNKSAKACGFFPRFCLKNSLCLLNPVPGMRMRTTRTLGPSASEVSRLTRNAYSGPQSQILDKHDWDAVYEKRCDSGVKSHHLHEADKKLIGKSSQLTSFNESSPRWRSRGAISPYRNEAPQSPFHEGSGFLGVPELAENVKGLKANNFKFCNKDRNNFQHIPSHQRYRQKSGSVSPAVEKMLYIDSVNIVESIPSETKGLIDSPGDDLGTLVESGGMEKTSKVESSVDDIKFLNILEGGNILKPKASGSVEADIPSSIHISDLKCQADRMEGLEPDRSLNQEPPRPLECSTVHTNGNLGMKREHILIADDQENSNVGSLQSLLPPPLPKSPSESWLWRALPSISSRNSFSQSHFGTQLHPKNQGQKTSATGTKWETIVKTSNLHYDHVRYSEELIPHISQRSKT
ncbi:hypothetical protein F0562_013909 [Nyssa sinensis]|uniref:Uncharacterized protein n=1 Tax=Nyssa sinensis TaxID=561372 RepID=A0A5J4ZPI1_9ASTE|nr:hypothetical protein F0562_013909 [Nyssa sinensis]